MTLKEKFDVISCKDCDMPYCEIKCTMLSEYELNKLEKIADEYAIEFFHWYENEMDKNRIKELLEIYKKEKGL
jgi:hypothetical protein